MPTLIDLNNVNVDVNLSSIDDFDGQTGLKQMLDLVSLIPDSWDAIYDVLSADNIYISNNLISYDSVNDGLVQRSFSPRLMGVPSDLQSNINTNTFLYGLKTVRGDVVDSPNDDYKNMASYIESIAGGVWIKRAVQTIHNAPDPGEAKSLFYNFCEKFSVPDSFSSTIYSLELLPSTDFISALTSFFIKYLLGDNGAGSSGYLYSPDNIGDVLAYYNRDNHYSLPISICSWATIMLGVVAENLPHVTSAIISIAAFAWKFQIGIAQKVLKWVSTTVSDIVTPDYLTVTKAAPGTLVSDHPNFVLKVDSDTEILAGQTIDSISSTPVPGGTIEYFFMILDSIYNNDLWIDLPNSLIHVFRDYDDDNCLYLESYIKMDNTESSVRSDIIQSILPEETSIYLNSTGTPVEIMNRKSKLKKPQSQYVINSRNICTSFINYCQEMNFLNIAGYLWASQASFLYNVQGTVSPNAEIWQAYRTLTSRIVSYGDSDSCYTPWDGMLMWNDKLGEKLYDWVNMPFSSNPTLTTEELISMLHHTLQEGVRSFRTPFDPSTEGRYDERWCFLLFVYSLVTGQIGGWRVNTDTVASSFVSQVMSSARLSNSRFIFSRYSVFQVNNASDILNSYGKSLTTALAVTAVVVLSYFSIKLFTGKIVPFLNNRWRQSRIASRTASIVNDELSPHLSSINNKIDDVKELIAG